MQVTKIKADDKSVIIVGAGWSGLACAITLIQAGFQVTLLESAPQAGGRARSIHTKHSSLMLDNGQHIMLGAYHFTRRMFKILGLKEAELLEISPLELNMFSPEKIHCQLKAPSLPAPLHLLFALFFLQEVSLKERLIAISMALKLASCRYKLNKDLSVESLLLHYKQSKKLIKIVWEPLCLATMNTPIEYASGQVFLSVLKDSFSKKKQDSNLLFFKQDLSRVFSIPAIQYIHDNGSSIICADKVKQIQIDKPFEFEINTHHKDYMSHYLVLACPAHISKKLLNSANTPVQLFPQTASLNYYYEPIYTIYLQYPEYIKLSNRMQGFFSLSQKIISQWAIDRSVTGQNGLIAVIISASGHHTQLTNTQLVNTIHLELKLLINNLPDFLSYKIIKEKRATFSCRVNIEQQRPKNHTSVPGLYLAGDYTATGYPATLEGAVKSGVMAARQIIQQNS